MVRAIKHECNSGDQFALLADIHLDNPKADLDYFHKVMKESVKRNAKVIIAGDLFCAMQGKFDRRASKDDLRPEHWGGNYFDKIVNWMFEQLRPYAHNILLISYGNHETSILKHHETDLIDRVVTLLNFNTGSDIQIGAYACWINFFVHEPTRRTSKVSSKMYIFHGAGGGGPVTKGVIQNQRLDAMISNADITLCGHVHEKYILETAKEHLKVTTAGLEVVSRPVYHVRTSTFKDESMQGIGFHTERGAPHKPLGGYWMSLNLIRKQKNYKTVSYCQPQFEMTQP